MKRRPTYIAEHLGAAPGPPLAVVEIESRIRIVLLKKELVDDVHGVLREFRVRGEGQLDVDLKTNWT